MEIHGEFDIEPPGESGICLKSAQGSIFVSSNVYRNLTLKTARKGFPHMRTDLKRTLISTLIGAAAGAGAGYLGQCVGST